MSQRKWSAEVAPRHFQWLRPAKNRPNKLAWTFMSMDHRPYKCARWHPCYIGQVGNHGDSELRRWLRILFMPQITERICSSKDFQRFAPPAQVLRKQLDFHVPSYPIDLCRRRDSTTKKSAPSLQPLNEPSSLHHSHPDCESTKQTLHALSRSGMVQL